MFMHIRICMFTYAYYILIFFVSFGNIFELTTINNRQNTNTIVFNLKI